MMNPRRSVILATGVVGLLAAFGPAGIQNTGVAPRNDISAPFSLHRTGTRRGTAAKARCLMTIPVKPM
jgi:hypothetical protein